MSMTAHISTPTAAAAERMLSSARVRAEQLGVRVAIAIVDGAGSLTGFIKMPGSFLSSSDLAIDKAFTAASFSMPTRSFGALLESVPRAVRDGLLRRPRLTEVPGGFPIELDGQLAGAVGVSGGSEEEDEDVASHAVAAIAAETVSGRI